MASSANISSSCLPAKPFVQLGDGLNAPVLNYNLPQKTCYNGNGYFPFAIPESYFAEGFSSLPEGNAWDVAASMSVDDISNRIKAEVLGSENSFFLRGVHVLKGRPGGIKFLADEGVKYLQPDPNPKILVQNESQLRVMPLNLTGGKTEPRARINHQTALNGLAPDKIVLGGYSLAFLADQVNNGQIPEFYLDFDRRVKVRFLPKPVIKPRLTLVEHYRLCSFLGDYGAGKVVKTFSLLPGESTTISIRSFKDRTSAYVKSSETNSNEFLSTYYAQDEESVSSLSENILEGYSEHAVNQLQNHIESQTTEATGASNASTIGHSTSGGGGVQGGFNLLGLLNAQVGGGVQVSGSNSFSSNGYRDTLLATLNSALTASVNESGNYRDVQVNATTGNVMNQGSGGSGGTSNSMSISQQESTIIKSGEEESTIRNLQNINFSRVLNFVFRQLLQEFVVLTWLEDISIVFETGYPGHKRIIKLPMLESFLAEAFPVTSERAEVRKAILLHLCNVFNYQGAIIPFAESVSEEYQDCVDALTIPAIQYWRKRSDIVDSYTSGGLEIAVPGVILNVQKHILPTDSVIVDAVLGQGEALDCYNIRLQNAAAYAAEQANNRATQEAQDNADRNAAALAVLNGITDPVQAAEAFRKMFGECCMEDIMLLLEACKPNNPNSPN